MSHPLEITVEELRRLRGEGHDVLVVDVRDAAEFEAGHVDGAVHIPGSKLAERLHELRSASVVVTACGKGGGRSLAAATLLRESGLSQARYLEGGTLAWIADHQQSGGER